MFPFGLRKCELMTIIKKLSKHITDEVEDAICYAKWAVEVKDSNRSLADTLYSLSQDEMKHASELHDEVVKLIEEYREEHGEPPAAMQAVYDYIHEQQIEAAAEARRYQAIYKER